MFQTAKQTKVFQDVVEQIQEAIFDGRLETGQTLPAERELKTMFNISRGTLREALRVLEQKGLIEIKLGVGGGSVVKTVDTEQVSESLGLLIRSQKVSLNHLAQFREDVEGIIASHAAKKHTKKDIQTLHLLLDRQLCRQGTFPTKRVSKYRQTDPYDDGGHYRQSHLYFSAAFDPRQHPSILRSVSFHGRTRACARP